MQQDDQHRLSEASVSHSVRGGGGECGGVVSRGVVSCGIQTRLDQRYTP